MDKKSPTFPLTQSQLSLWTGQRMHPDKPLHNAIYTFNIAGNIDQKVFQRAFQQVLDCTDALRTVFGEKNGTPYQSFRSPFPYTVELLDFSSEKNSSEADESALEHFIVERTQRPFSLGEQIFDTLLLKITDTRYIWYLNIHHLVTDAISFGIIYGRMNRLYQKLGNGYSGEIVKPPAFQDYIAFENRQVNDPDNATHRAYWQEKTADRPDIPKLYGNPSDSNRTAARRFSVKLDKERRALLEERVKDPDVWTLNEPLTEFTIFATLFFIFLNRISGQQKLSIGAPAHNRTKPAFRQTAGLFLEVLPLFLEIKEKDTFTSVFERMQEETLSYLRHVRPGMAPTGTGPNFNAILNYISADFPDFDGFPTETEWVHSGYMDSSHAIRCHIYDFKKDGGKEIAFDLNHSVFPEAIANCVLDHFLSLFDALLEDRHLCVGKPSLLSLHEKRMLSSREWEKFTDGEATSAESLSSIVADFEKQVAERPNAIALQCGTETLTYSALNKKAIRLANHLRKKGIGPTDNVALYLYRGTEYVTSILASLKAGAAFIPIASDQASGRIDYILSDSGCSLIITEEGLKNKIDSENVPILLLSEENIGEEPVFNWEIMPKPENPAYILYTSGSTGRPKGVLISHGALSNYMAWAGKTYQIDGSSVFPLFTSIGFDLTLTSTLLPLLNGGRVIIYPEKRQGPDLALLQVMDDNLVNTIKLTPSHLALLRGRDFSASHIKTMIVGGEDFKTALARSITATFGKDLKIYNEYGPTEATVGCIVSLYDPQLHTGTAVPIGKPIDHMQAYVLDASKNLVPLGVVGELYLTGTGLANGYIGDREMTGEKFMTNPFSPGSKMYRTGDLVRLNMEGQFEYKGRIDDQVKLSGHRIELADIESNLITYPGVKNCAVVVTENEKRIPESEVVHCIRCGLPSNYPDADFNENGICHLCTAFDTYKAKVERYFKNDNELLRILTSKRGENPQYDCISLLSGGKDSTYVLARLVDMGLKVLAFTMDNGYISRQAKDNVERIVGQLGVDHVYGETPHMNEIFVDSLHRHHNVCNGCFKTIYTLSTQIALEKKIPFIVTGLSRGQFFETRLTEELFWDDRLDITKIDDTILEARKLYHRESDAVKQLLDVSAFEDDAVFEKVQFIDFYRYSDVSLEELLTYLDTKIGWVRPTDTGRSTNCLINQVGIYVHKKEEGYSNYAFPYSWDVRLGHKKRQESLEEINEAIDENEVHRIMDEIGYDRSEKEGPQSEKLVAYFTGNPEISVNGVKDFLSEKLPSYMVPAIFKHLEELPLTKNGKVDKKALENLNSVQLDMDTPYIAPRNDIEELLEEIWKEVLQLKKVGVHDDFIGLGGHSLAAIRVTARVNENLQIDFPLNKIFERPTIATYATFIEETLTELLKE